MQYCFNLRWVLAYSSSPSVLQSWMSNDLTFIHRYVNDRTTLEKIVPDEYGKFHGLMKVGNSFFF